MHDIITLSYMLHIFQYGYNLGKYNVHKGKEKEWEEVWKGCSYDPHLERLAEVSEGGGAAGPKCEA
jgi:hypothetical protein